LLEKGVLTGEVVQNQRTKDLVFNCSDIVSLHLNPGDVIYTGTPQNTKAMKPGDTIEVEIESVGLLRNRIGSKGSSTTSQ
jgi:2-keto-4-pentenoate hydratase/2-oxohepta-3-ene-1,7-dioic acid hydratase in catechol pathway